MDELKSGIDPHQVSREAMRSTSLSDSKQVAQNNGQEMVQDQPQLEPPDPLDWYDRVDSSKAEKAAGIGQSHAKQTTGQPSRFQRYLERAKEVTNRAKASTERVSQKVQEFKERYPNASRYGGYVAKTVGVVAKNSFIGKAATVVSHVPDAWDVYKDAKQFVHYIRQHPDLKPENFIKSKPYHELYDVQRQKQFDKEVKELWSQLPSSKLEHSRYTDEVRYRGTDITPSDMRQREENLRHFIIHAPKSLEYKLSYSSSRHLDKIYDFRVESVSKANEHGKMALEGTATDRYHLLLNHVEQQLGSGYFDPVKNPQGVLAFERFAHEHLQVSGFTRAQANTACSHGLACRVLIESEKNPNLFAKQGEQYVNQLRRDAVKILEQRFVAERSKDLDFHITREQRFRDNNAQASKRLLAHSDMEHYGTWQKWINDYHDWRSYQNKVESLKAIHDYHAASLNNLDQSASYQFMLQYGRDLLEQKGKDPHIGDIVYKLHVAGHEKEKTIEVLSQYHPQVNESRRLAERKFDEMIAETQKNTSRQAEMRYIQEFKQFHGIEAEKRLDRLPFHEQRSFSQHPPEQRPQLQPTSSTDAPFRGTQDRELEIER